MKVVLCDFYLFVNTTINGWIYSVLIPTDFPKRTEQEVNELLYFVVLLNITKQILVLH